MIQLTTLRLAINDLTRIVLARKVTSYNSQKRVRGTGTLTRFEKTVHDPAYKQITFQAGTYQVPNAHNGMMLNIGGSATTNYVFIVGME